jgi:hypothetical protein
VNEKGEWQPVSSYRNGCLSVVGRAILHKKNIRLIQALQARNSAAELQKCYRFLLFGDGHKKSRTEEDTSLQQLKNATPPSLPLEKANYIHIYLQNK